MFSSVKNIVSPYGAYSHVQYLLSVISNVRSILHPPTHQSLSFAYSNYVAVECRTVGLTL